MGVQAKSSLVNYKYWWLRVNKTLTYLGSVGIAIGTVFVNSVAFAQPSQLLPNSVNNAAVSQIVSYTPPPDAGTPQPTGGTGSRGGCQYRRDRPNPVSLVGQSHLMRTISDRPTIWIYVPYSSQDVSRGTFSLQQGDDELYRADFRLAGTPGVLGISIPETAPALVLNQDYEWFIDIHCSDAIDDETDPAVLEGGVQRVPIPVQLSHDLASAQSGLEKVTAYGKHSIWYDLLTTLARFRLASEPKPEFEKAWIDILSDKTVLLDSWAMEKLVGEAIADQPAVIK